MFFFFFDLEFHLQTTARSEKHDQPSLLSDRQFASADRVHGKHQYQTVCRDREASVCEPELFQVDASGGHRLVPGAADGIALQDRQGHWGYHVTGDKTHESKATPAEPSVDEDAEVEEEHWDLGQVHGEFVEDLSNIV